MAFLRHIALRTKDMEASRLFYETIGFEFVGYRGRGGLGPFGRHAEHDDSPI